MVEALERREDALLSAMVGLFRQGQQPHHEAYPEHFGPVDDTAKIVHYLQNFLKPRNPLRQRYGFAKGWYVDGEMMGYLLYRVSRSDDIFYGKPRWNCFIEDIVVDARARGMGGASALMEALVDEVAALGECAVSGNVWRMNEASQALFEKHGFEALSQTFFKVTP